MSIERVALSLGAGRFALAIEQAAIRFAIESEIAKAHWLAQLAHESGGFQFTREIWGPTPAQARYEFRRDLGNTAKGDGFRFRGRGLIQITGRANYRDYSQCLYSDERCLLTPEMLEAVPDAALCAGWFWRSRGLNVIAETDDLVAVTKRINGGINGLKDRATWLARVKQAFAQLSRSDQ